MDTPRKFYMQKFTVTVLSEEPIPSGMSLSEILIETDTGDYVADHDEGEVKELSEEQCAEMLEEFGSIPEFFQIESKHNG